ncbi:MAG: patatin-like phospholipase family protein [Gemmatimonadota bacterium]
MTGRGVGRACRPFTLVLAGGGARGFAHVGVLRALEAYGLRPSALVGVSMGAVVGASYALNPDWYRQLLEMDTSIFPGPREPPGDERGTWSRKIGAAWRNTRVLWEMFRGWGPGERAFREGNALLRDLTLGRNLEQGRVPIAVSTTDLQTGERVVLRSGPAAEAVYASAALAGVLPPLSTDGRLLCDGAYADLAPIDSARALGPDTVIAVDPVQSPRDTDIRNGLEALMRAVEICHIRHAELRFREADLVLRPRFRRPIEVLEFDAKRECVAAGVRVVRERLPDLSRRLSPAPSAVRPL